MFFNKIETKSNFLPLLCAGIAILLCSCDSNKDTPVIREMIRPAKTMVLQSPETITSRSYPGKVQASRKSLLTFKVSGPLLQLPVNEGDQVEKGTLLARIDPRDFKTALAKIGSNISTARARLKGMKVARPEDINVLNAQVSSAKAQLRQAKQEYERYADLYEQNLASKSDYDRYKSGRDIAKAQLKTAKQNLEKGKKGARKEDIEAMVSDVRGLEVGRKQASDALEDTYLRAPFSGRVAKKFVENFQNVRAGEPVVSLQDISGLEIVMNAPEQVVAESTGIECVLATAVFDSLPGKEYELKIKEFAVEADAQTRTYQVVFSMKAPESGTILPGMTATVKAADKCAKAGDSGFLIPVNATFADEYGKSFVWVVDPGTMTVSRREVGIGDMAGENIRIRKGVTAGEMIVTAGVSHLQEGMKIRLLKGKTGG